ncbi:FixH family protein [uncultured Maricaulis sp.]|uniref:FixH family protein n=1 Tax=uncultured Maricaulis sp. TaxID=174710 RepID=UPI0030DC1FBD|tara:strand:+ start:93564 stop:94031 length:468 start_codon:yes stop_codon:yes gene_type:complete
MKTFLNPLRGWHVLVMILMFFGVTIGVNATFITLALTTFPGEDVPHSYVQGINYNDTIERRRAQAELGWTARFNAADDALLLEVLDAEGTPVSGLALTGSMVHPDSMQDCPLTFAADRPGIYRASLDCDASGRWRVRAINDGDAPFEVEYELWLP